MRKSHLAVVVFALGGAAGCASLQAKAPEKPALNVPAPPPHVVELPAEPLEPVGEIPSPNSTPATRPARPATRDTAPRPQPDKPAEKPPDTTPVEAPPVPVQTTPPTPAPQLSTPQAGDSGGAAAKTARTTIDSARNTLGRVNFGPLSNERKKAYHDAELFIKQAEDALKDGNIVFAQAMATKAETLARELIK
jgi:hypothetical protein